jgi:hypothetical protein
LHNAADTNLAADDSSGPGSGSLTEPYMIQSSGTYYVVVSKYYWSSQPANRSYQVRVDVARDIQLESDREYANDSISGANTLTLTQGLTGHLRATVAGTVMLPQSSNADEDRFSWGTINSGNVVELNVRVPSNSTLLPKVTLRDSTGAALADEDGTPFVRWPRPPHDHRRRELLRAGRIGGLVLPWPQVLAD